METTDKPVTDAEIDPSTNDGVANQAGKEPVPQAQTKPIPPDGVHPVNQGIKPHAHHGTHGNRDQPTHVTDKDRPLGQQNPAPVPGSPGYVEPRDPAPVDAEDKND